MHLKEEALKKASQNQENLVAQLTTEKTKTQQQMQFIKRLQRKLLLISKVNYKRCDFPCNCMIKIYHYEDLCSNYSSTGTMYNGTSPRFFIRPIEFDKSKDSALFWHQERDMYKSLIDSYQSEVTVNISTTASSRIQQLEDILESYRKQIESMETEISKVPTNQDITLNITEVRT